MSFVAIIRFVTSPVGKYVGIALAVLAFVAWQRHDAASDARAVAEAECQAEVQERTTAEIQRQRQVAERVLEEARRRAAITEAELAELQERADALVAELAESNTSCPLDLDTLRRLREIR